MSRQRCLFLMQTRQLGGAERVVMDYLRFINHDSCEAVWAVKKDIFTPLLRKEGVPASVVELPAGIDTAGMFRRFFLYLRFFRRIRAERVVFSQFWLSSFSLPEIAAARLSGARALYMIVHDCAGTLTRGRVRTVFGLPAGAGLAWRRDRLFQKLLHRFVTHTVAVSAESARFLEQHHRFPSRAFTVCYHGVDTARFSPGAGSEVRARFGIGKEDSVIISTARFDAIKRIDRLIEAFNRLARTQHNLQLILVGGGAQEEQLRAACAALEPGVAGRIHFAGVQQDVVPFLRAADIYCLPSDSEGLSIAALEALSCGVPAVVTSCGGMPELIKDGCNGFLVEKSVDGVYAGLERILLLGESGRRTMGARARTDIEERFDITRNVREFLQLTEIPCRN